MPARWPETTPSPHDFVALVDPIRYPADLSNDQAREIRRIKARVESERLPRGADPARHLKLGRGGLSDVEWLVQLLQLQHAHERPELRTSNTLEALSAIAAAGLLPEDDAGTLGRSWSLATRIRSANVIWAGKNSDLLPSSRRDLEAVARWCGYEPGNAGGDRGRLSALDPPRARHFRALLLRLRHLSSRPFSGTCAPRGRRLKPAPGGTAVVPPVV